MGCHGMFVAACRFGWGSSVEKCSEVKLKGSLDDGWILQRGRAGQGRDYYPAGLMCLRGCVLGLLKRTCD